MDMTPKTDREAAINVQNAHVLLHARTITGSFGDAGNRVRLYFRDDGTVELYWLVYGPGAMRFSVPGGEYVNVYEMMECRPELSSVTDWQATR